MAGALGEQVQLTEQPWREPGEDRPLGWAGAWGGARGRGWMEESAPHIWAQAATVTRVKGGGS